MGRSRRFFKKPSLKRGKLAYARLDGEVNDNTFAPAFNLKELPSKGDYSLDKCEQREKAALIATLEKLSRMTWGEIQASHKHNLGYEVIDQNRLGFGEGAMQADAKLLVFRFSGKKGRMIGYRIGRIFYICWLDRNHDLF